MKLEDLDKARKLADRRDYLSSRIVTMSGHNSVNINGHDVWPEFAAVAAKAVEQSMRTKIASIELELIELGITIDPKEF